MIQLAFTGFLLGALGIAVPIILHLIRKKPTEVTAFPAFMFLHKSIVAKQSRNNIRKWIILLLRCLAILLLSFAFAWPYFPNFSKSPETATVLLWDNSFSMGAKPYFEKMKSDALKQIKLANSANPLLIGLISEKIRWSPKFDSDSAGMMNFFEKNVPSEGTSLLESAIRQADAALQEIPSDKKRIILFTDKQKLPWRNVYLKNPLSPGVDFVIKAPDNPGFKNVSVRSIESLTPFTKAGTEIILSVKLRNFSDENAKGELKTYVANKSVSSEKIEIKAGEQVSKTLSVIPEKFVPTPLRVEFMFEDDIPLDNKRFFSLNPLKLPRIVINGGDKGFDFVKLSFQTSKDNRVAEFLPLSKNNVNKSDFAILRDAISFESPEAKALLKSLEDGRSMLVIWEDSPGMRNFLLQFGIKASAIKDEKKEHFEMINFGHPIFRRFKDLKVASFFDIVFFSPSKLQLPENAILLANFSNGAPAIAEIPVGKGKLIVIASSLNRKSTNWAVHSTFLPFMRELLRYCRPGKKDNSDFIVGTEVKLGQYNEVLDLESSSTISPGKSFCPDKTGNYLLKNKGRTKAISINTLAEESESKLLSEKFNVSSLISTKKREKKEGKASFPSNDQGKAFWWIVLLVALIMVLSELLLANRTAL